MKAIWISTVLLLSSFAPTQAQSIISNAEKHRFSENGQLLNHAGQPFHGIAQKFLRNGVKANEHIMRAGVKHGHAAYYYDNGTLKESGNYLENKRQGVWKTWNKRGVLLSTISYQNGIKHGKGSLFHTNGVQKMTVSYDQDTKVGVWVSYSKEGQFLSKIVY